MFSRLLKIGLILLLVLSSTPPVNADTEDEQQEEEPAQTSETETEEETEEETDGETEVTTSKELDSSKAATIKTELLTKLKDYGLTGEETVVTVSDNEKKAENGKVFNDLVLSQLQLYELLYSTDIELTLDKAVTKAKIDNEIKGLEDILATYNAINAFAQKQISVMKETDGIDENLLAAFSNVSIDVTPVKGSIEDVRKNVQTALNTRTAASIDNFFTYLNGGKDATDVKTLLEDEDTKKLAKDLINIVNQWKTLPHIENADSSIVLTGIASVNEQWLAALETLIDDMETETGGANDGTDTIAETTNPELATSVLGRLGSSLFTVARSDSADNDPHKPLTGTLGWTVETENKKSPDEYDPGPAAKDTFLAAFASTALYIPMISHVGDKDYVEAFKSLFNSTPEPLGDDDEKVRFAGSPLGPLDILSQIQNLKKPLYYYDDLEELGEETVYGNSTHDVKGPTKLLTVGALMASIEKKREVAAVTMHGVLEQNGDSWAFYNYYLNKDGTTGNVVPTTDSEADETELEEEGTVTADVEDAEPVQDEPSTDLNAPSAGTGNAGIPMTSKVPADRDTNGGQEQTRVVFEMTFNDENPGAALLTGSIMYNILQDSTVKSRFKERANEAVYLDVVGNLVLNDGLIVLPAATNPVYWAIPDSQKELEEGSQSFTYNPFTVAFADSYPAIYQGGSTPSSVNEKKDKKKFIIGTFDELVNGYITMPIKEGYKSTWGESRVGHLKTEFKVDGVSGVNTELVEVLETSMGVDNKDEIASESFWTYGSAKPIKLNNLVTSEGSSIFPYINQSVSDPTGDESFNINTNNYTSAILIAKNMYAYIIGEAEEDSSDENVSAASGTSEGGSSSGRLREGFLFNNVVMPTLTGVTTATEFDKTHAKADLLLAKGDSNVVTKWIINTVNWLTEVSTDRANILAIANPDDVTVLKVIYGVTIEYGFYVVFILIMLILVLFIREGDFFASMLKGGAIILVLGTTMFLVPLFIPWLTNFTSAPLTKDTTLNTLMTRLELTEKVHTLEPAGSSGLSVKLYNLSPSQAKQLNGEHFMEGNYLTNQFSVNDQLGMFVKGSELRLDLYAFMRFNPLIVATGDNVNNPNTEVSPTAPQIYNANHSKSIYATENETVGNDMSYNNDILNFYAPYNLLQDGFITNLNKYLAHYDPPQSVVRYPNGLVKTSYIMNSYMKSLAFLSAEPDVAKLISTEETEEGYAHLGITKAEVDLVNQKFYPYGDVLGLQSWVETEWNDLPNYYTNSLWGQNLFNLGYYEPDTGIGERVKLANRVNRRAYDIIIRMSETQGLVSDETMIKLVALYSTFEFNKAVSYMDNNIYPRSVSMNEISATDIMSATVLGQSKQFQFYDTALVSNIYYEHGLIGLAAYALALVLLIIYSILLSFLLPVLVIGLICYVIYLIVTNKNIMPALKFTARILILAVIVNFALVLVIKTYTLHNNLYVFTLLLLVVIGGLLFLLFRAIFKRKSARHQSWQMKHLRNNYGNDYSHGYDRGYDSSQDYGRGRSYSQEPLDNSGLTEEGGYNDRGRSNKYNY